MPAVSTPLAIDQKSSPINESKERGFSRAAFAIDEDIGRGWSDAIDELKDLQHGGALADDGFQTETFV